MANALFDAGRNAFLTGAIDWADVPTNISVALVDTGSYTVDLANHTNMSSVVAGVIAEVPLITRTAVAGVADAADVTFTSVTGLQSEALVIFLDTGVDANDTLIAYIDTATGLPVTPNTGDIIVQWSDGVNKIFKL